MYSLLSLFLGFLPIQMAQASVEAGLVLETTLEYQDGNQAPIKSEATVVLTERARTWVPLLKPSEKITLLGRLAQKDGAKVRVEYILLDHSKPNPVISTPQIISKLEIKTELQESNRERKISISLTPTMVALERRPRVPQKTDPSVAALDSSTR